MRLSANRIRSINRRLARAQGYTWPARHTSHPAAFAVPEHIPAIVARIPVLRIVAVPRSAAA
jgi:hypothetical protein